MTTDELRHEHALRREEILARLNDFHNIERSQWFYELCYCFLTPQSKAVHADAAVGELKQRQFFETGCDIVDVLRAPSHYIRFHNTKSKRLQELRTQWTKVEGLLESADIAENKTDIHRMRQLRDVLQENVTGIGMKEASHFLRNIGGRGLAIIDRHLISSLMECGVLNDPPKLGSVDRYKDIESRFEAFSAEVGVSMDELDLTFWSLKTGFIFK